MKRTGLLLMAVLTVIGFAGCSEDKESTGGTVWATDDGKKPPAAENPVITGTSSPASTSSSTSSSQSQEITIAKCLSAEGAILYGASWCTYTQKQIASFGDGYQYLSYVECTEQASLCKEKGISAYPTWIIDGSRYQGYRVPTAIGAIAGCTW